MAVPERRKVKEPPTGSEIRDLAAAVRGLNMTMVRMDERLAKALDEQREFTKNVLDEIRRALNPKKDDAT